MQATPCYTVVGVRADGTDSVLTRHVQRDAAEAVLQKIHPQSEFTVFRLVLDVQPAAHVKRSARIAT